MVGGYIRPGKLSAVVGLVIDAIAEKGIWVRVFPLPLSRDICFFFCVEAAKRLLFFEVGACMCILNI